ncbi:hypothetical protein [Microcoleus sp. herbarium2]|uniref:hypothetical protein n=1 Tax=Microcoleus sp. herbarium2 TaxID=3055433 RepID=UPI002FD6578D
MQLKTDNCCIGFMRSLFHFRRSLIRNNKGRSILMRDGAIATRTIIAVFGIWCEGRSLFFTQASISVESSQCLVFGMRGDRS